ncbi:MAG: NgoPII family restriction endonuclease [Treponema sp.]|nr:NgoPII family restriction endonuclease [Treponema sp.]
MSNIISAIINLVENPKIELIRKGSSHNRANNMGEALEEYIKDLFANTVDIEDEQIRNVAIATTFSYLGNQNNPPDSMLHGGDAIEVKKIESKNSALALNSSYPKAKLFSDSPMISKACKEAENWTVKDMIYAVGVVKGNNLESLAFVYGEDYCANKETYETIMKKEFSDALNTSTITLSKNKWQIKNPFKVFDYVYKESAEEKFDFMCIINTDKFDSFGNTPELYELAKSNKKLSIQDVHIKNPNNPAQLRKAKLITFKKEVV